MKYAFLLTTTLLASGILLGNAQASEWAYEGAHGPDHWAELDSANASCAIGKHQSPINITAQQSHSVQMPALDFSYHSASADIINNGHTVQVNLPAGNHFQVGEQTAELLQFHFHTPSEERFDGKSYPMNAHLVHKTAAGTLSVVAVEFQEGKDNPALQPILESLPAVGQTRSLAQFNPAALLPRDHSYYRFTGSLTTPPCSENVSWQVLKQPVELSKAQIDAFRALYKMNARPVQPLNDRVIELSQ